MVTAIVLIHSEPGSVNEVAEELSELKGVTEVYSVAGEWDPVAILRVAHNEELANLVTSGLGKIRGIKSTESLIAFRAYPATASSECLVSPWRHEAPATS